MKVFIIILSGLLLLGSGSLLAQGNNITVRGTVKDKDTRTGLPGVAIVIKGTPDRGVGVTKNDGSFVVLVPQNAMLTFSFIGFKPFTVKAEPTLTVFLEENISKLNEIVIRGFQSKSRELSSGSSVVISGKDLQDVPVSNAEQLLQGKVAGLNIQVSTGAPGFRGGVLLRGLSNIDVTVPEGGANDNEAYLSPTSPLYVIDGVPTDVDPATADGFNSFGGASPLSLIPQEDIANIEVLKDAQATSLYGSRGAYGVILITTRRGQSAVPRVRYTSNFFVNTPPQLRKTIGGSAERDMKMAQILQYGSPSDVYLTLGGATGTYLTDSLNAYYNNSTNWQEIFYGSTFNQTHNIGLEGGDTKFNYKTNFGYYNEKGIQKNTGVNRYNLNTNIEYKPSDKISLFAQVNGSLLERKKGNSIGILNSGVAKNSSASTLLPGPSLYLASNDLLASLNVENSNPTKNLKTNLVFTLKPVTGISLSTTGSYDMVNSTDDTFTPAVANSQSASIRTFNDTRSTLYNRNNISLAKSINDHEFSGFFFNEIYIRNYQSNLLGQSGLSSDNYRGPLGFASGFGDGKGAGLVSYSRSRAVSFAGSFSYNYKRKYVLDATYRMDATSFSGVEDPFTRSPSLGIRWNADKEEFLKDISWLSYSSIRLSWGKSTVPTGNIFSVFGTFEPKGTYNGQPRIGLSYEDLPNTDVGTGVSTTYNGGLDFGLFKNRIEVSFDTYYRAMDRQTRKLELSNIAGFKNVISNEISIRNYGTELSLTTRPLSPTSKVKWMLTVNGALNKDILTKLPGNVDQIIIGSTVFHVGRNSLSNYLYENTGVYSSSKDVPVDPVTGLPLRSTNYEVQKVLIGGGYYQAGDPIFTDANGDYIISDADRKVLGNSQPLFTGGFNTNVGYGSFNVSVNGSVTFKRDLMNNAMAERLGFLGSPFGVLSSGRYEQRVILPLDNITYWKNQGDVARFPNPYNYSRFREVYPLRSNQSLFQEDGSYLKINSITLSYTLKKSLVNKMGLNNIRVYGSTNNFASFSRYSGPNAENVSALGYDNSGGYPLARTYNLGINVEL